MERGWSLEVRMSFAWCGVGRFQGECLFYGAGLVTSSEDISSMERGWSIQATMSLERCRVVGHLKRERLLHGAGVVGRFKRPPPTTTVPCVRHSVLVGNNIFSLLFGNNIVDFIFFLILII